MNCLTEDELLAWLDAPEPEASAHVRECERCRSASAELRTFLGDVAALPPFDEDAHVAKILRRIDVRGRRWRIAAVVATVALAASIVLLVRPRSDETFTARGAASAASLRRDVGLVVHTGDARLEDGAVIPPDARLSAATTNLHPRPVRLLLFAIDAANTVHWLAPAYLDSKTNPESITVERSERNRRLPTEVVLEDPAEGALRIVAVFTEAPLRVSDIETRSADALSVSSLERAFPSASVSELRVRVGEGQ